MRRQILLLLALFTLLGINARQRSLNEMQQAAAKALGNQSRIKKSMSTKPMGAIKMLKEMPSVVSIVHTLVMTQSEPMA